MPKVSYEGLYDTNGFPRTDVYVPNSGETLLRGVAASTDSSGQSSALAGMAVVDKGGVNTAVVDAQGEQLMSSGGSNYQGVASAASQSVKASPGRLCKVFVITLGTGIATIYDNTAGSGTQLFVVPASAPAGTVYDLQIVAKTGIFAVSAASGPVLNVTFA